MGTPLIFCDGCDKFNVCDSCIITQLSNEKTNQEKKNYCRMLQSIFIE